ncbi:hypothetical protein FGRMN_5133 [Fusarium graminum]|nr:hypothetical protein FGRMN_5133 [Fusarium graminum]
MPKRAASFSYTSMLLHIYQSWLARASDKIADLPQNPLRVWTRLFQLRQRTKQRYYNVATNPFAKARREQFQGRGKYSAMPKLQGKVVKLPEQCRGVVVERVPEENPEATVEEPIEVDNEEEKIGSMQIKAEFDEIVVWGHETVADASADPYVRGIEEWLQVADQIHSYST